MSIATFTACLTCTGLKVFTVCGPWGRPDMALLPVYKMPFSLAGRPRSRFSIMAKCKGIFTYIDDITEGLARIIPVAYKSRTALLIPQRPTRLRVRPLENLQYRQPRYSGPGRFYRNSGKRPWVKKAIREYLPMQPGDVESTWADVVDLKK